MPGSFVSNEAFRQNECTKVDKLFVFKVWESKKRVFLTIKQKLKKLKTLTKWDS